MPFAAGLREVLSGRDCQIATELDRGDSLEEVLDRHLIAVEQMSERELVTSILLLSPDGRRLSHGAGPSLPRPYRDSIDGSEIGPRAGSCGTAAYLGKPVYVADIAADPLWSDYRHLALPYGLRSCWSTPIRSPDGRLVGTFAIYHRTPGSPSADELDAIDMIAGHVAEAIVRAQGVEQRLAARNGSRPDLRLVADNIAVRESVPDPLECLMRKAERLDELARDLDGHAQGATSNDCRTALEQAAASCHKLAAIIRRRIQNSIDYSR